MKIYKIAQNYQMLAQNPGAQNDPNIQLQNLQNAQQALEYFKNVVNETDKIMANLRSLEDQLGIGDIGVRTQVAETIKAAVQRTEAFNLLAQMNLVSSVDNLLNQNELNNINNLVNTNIQTVSQQYASQSQMGAGQVMGQ